MYNFNLFTLEKSHYPPRTETTFQGTKKGSGPDTRVTPS